jgi:hypothetical protein
VALQIYNFSKSGVYFPHADVVNKINGTNQPKCNRS